MGKHVHVHGIAVGDIHNGLELYRARRQPALQFAAEHAFRLHEEVRRKQVDALELVASVGTLDALRVRIARLGKPLDAIQLGQFYRCAKTERPLFGHTHNSRCRNTDFGRVERRRRCRTTATITTKTTIAAIAIARSRGHGRFFERQYAVLARYRIHLLEHIVRNPLPAHAEIHRLLGIHHERFTFVRGGTGRQLVYILHRRRIRDNGIVLEHIGWNIGAR